MKIARTVAILSVLLVSEHAMAENIKWENLGRRDDYQISWASNLQNRHGQQVGTYLRFKYDRSDQAPNNARFDNQRITIFIDCPNHRYQMLGRTYNMGDRQVYAEDVDGEFERYDDTPVITKIATKVCPSGT
ncbi:hypothetical protein [Burkholderia cenocepacia]|uniref:hypothetical protein n=1 Tax=Burkholderia cenocepacia TaxID=95486 RepID=UPI0009CA5195|nr:hypothetical protein [Burkholderia cenocepacia]ONW32306.1 hypothetical protein A8E95_16160 [Burkholderia cenocepacia]